MSFCELKSLTMAIKVRCILQENYKVQCVPVMCVTPINRDWRFNQTKMEVLDWCTRHSTYKSNRRRKSTLSFQLIALFLLHLDVLQRVSIPGATHRGRRHTVPLENNTVLHKVHRFYAVNFDIFDDATDTLLHHTPPRLSKCTVSENHSKHT